MESTEKTGDSCISGSNGVKSIALPVGGRIHVRLLRSQGEQDRRSDTGALFIPDIVENTEDCECRVLAVSDGPGFELPMWVAERISRRYDISPISYLYSLCAQPRKPRVEVGKRYLFDVTVATQIPGKNDEFLVDEGDIYAEVGEDEVPVQLTKLQTDGAGYKTL
jgi:hypothetical protein